MELTEELIKRRSKQFDLGCITLLDLSQAGLARLANLDECANVIKLNLSNNAITDVDGLPVLKALLSLDLSNNRLVSVDDVPWFPSLEELVLSNNQIASIDFKTLASRLPRLRKLHVDSNPVEAKSTFLEHLRSAFPNLLTLNGEAIAFYEALSHAPSAPSEDLSSVFASPSTSSINFKLPPFDARQFAIDKTKHLEALLRDAQQTLETESKRVEAAFRLLET